MMDPKQKAFKQDEPLKEARDSVEGETVAHDENDVREPLREQGDSSEEKSEDLPLKEQE